jgi:hypothetical protein
MAIEELQSGTGAGMMLLLEAAPKLGLLRAETAKSYRAAVGQILQVAADGGDFDDVRVLDLDVDETLARFREERGDRYTAGSLASYETRFRKATDLYMRFLDDPKSIQPAPQRRVSRRDDPVTTATKDRTVTDWVAAQAGRVARAARVIDYRFPLVAGGTAYLQLPRELHPVDAERLTKFIESITIDPNRQEQLNLLDVPE